MNPLMRLASSVSCSHATLGPRGAVVIALALAIIPIRAAEADLIGHWKLDGNIQDSSRNGHHGRSFGAVFAESPQGQVVRMEGWGGRVVITNAPALNVGTNDFTVAGWINPLRLRHAGLIAKGSYEGTPGWLIDMMPDG